MLQSEVPRRDLLVFKVERDEVVSIDEPKRSPALHAFARGFVAIARRDAMPRSGRRSDEEGLCSFGQLDEVGGIGDPLNPVVGVFVDGVHRVRRPRPATGGDRHEKTEGWWTMKKGPNPWAPVPRTVARRESG